MYNSSSTIVRCLDSVLSQTYQDTSYEIIVINDGSTDNSKEIVDDFISHCNNTNYKINLINQTNGGVSKARNTGLRFAEGEIIALLDADDTWVQEKLEFQMRYLREDVDFLCALRNNESISFPYTVKDNIAQITVRKLLFKVIGQTSTAVFKRKVINNTGYFDEDQKYSEDANYWMRISLNNNMIVINETLVTTENDYGRNGLSGNLIEMEKGVQKNIKELFNLNQINFIEYCFFKLFSKVKYLRRIYSRNNDL